MENTITPNYEKLIGKKKEALIHNLGLQNSLMEYFNGIHHAPPDEHVLTVFGRIAWEARELEIEIANLKIANIEVQKEIVEKQSVNECKN